MSESGFQAEAVRLYCGVSERKWNHHPVDCGEYACVSPVTGKSARTKTRTTPRIPNGTRVIQDSGAFSDLNSGRLNFTQALIRQEEHAERYGYLDSISHRATYDILIDEVWDENQVRHKQRWSVSDAERAVEETVAAAKWLNKHRNGVPLVVSAQGVDASQYLRCAQSLIDIIREDDLFGMGGWCILGKMKKQMLPVFKKTVKTVLPFLEREGIKKLHIWGVLFPVGLGYLLWHCDQHGIQLSTDNSGVTTYPAFGRWGYGDWQDKGYVRHPPETRGLERARHVMETRKWLSNFRQTQYYKGD